MLFHPALPDTLISSTLDVLQVYTITEEQFVSEIIGIFVAGHETFIDPTEDNVRKLRAYY